MSAGKAELKKQLMEMMKQSGTDTELLEEFIKQMEGARKLRIEKPKVKKLTDDEKKEKVLKKLEDEKKLRAEHLELQNKAKLKIAEKEKKNRDENKTIRLKKK